MRVGSISNIISFGKGLGMAIPTDISKTLKEDNPSYYPSFGSLGLRAVAVPIYDTFVHIIK